MVKDGRQCTPYRARLGARRGGEGYPKLGSEYSSWTRVKRSKEPNEVMRVPTYIFFYNSGVDIREI